MANCNMSWMSGANFLWVHNVPWPDSRIHWPQTLDFKVKCPNCLTTRRKNIYKKLIGAKISNQIENAHNRIDAKLTGPTQFRITFAWEHISSRLFSLLTSAIIVGKSLRSFPVQNNRLCTYIFNGTNEAQLKLSLYNHKHTTFSHHHYL